jgi:hypothetical protein
MWQPDAPLLYLKLDDLDDTTAADSSPYANHATVQGQPTLVPDETFGACLNLDGQADSLVLPTAAIPTGNELTLSLWSFGGDELPRSTIILQAVGENNARILNVHLPWGDSNVYFDCGNDGTGYDRISQAADPTAFKGRWNHWAFVKNAATGEMSIYLNGALWVSGTGRTRPLPPSTAARLGADPSDQGLYPGKIAHVRIYPRALAADEIVHDMEGDRSSWSAFRRSFPIDFRLHDDDDQSVLYILDDPAGQPLHLDITNASTEALNLPAPATATAGDQNYHFAVRFRPGTLAPSAILAIQTALPTGLQAIGWSASLVAASNGIVTLYLLSTTGRTVMPGETITLTIPSAAADPGPGARGTRVELRYHNLTLGGEPTQISGRRVTHLSIVNRRGQKQIPLHAGFVGFGAVLNDGTTPNTLVLRVSNVLKEHPITWNPVGSSAPTNLVLSFDVLGTDGSEDWTLGDKDHVGAIVVYHPNTWQLTTPTGQEESPEWTLQPTAATLGPGETIQFTLTNIKTDTPTGQTNLYLRYQNVPGYWDGQLVVPIEKSPLLYMGNNIGIGTTSPPMRLTVSASDNHVQLRREANEATGGAHVFLELLQDDSNPPAVPEVYPSIRFNHGYRFWHRLEARSDGFHLLNGYPADNTEQDIHAATGHFSGNLALSGGSAIQQGISFEQPAVDFQAKDAGSWDYTWIVPNGIKIVAQEGGVLATDKSDVLMWKDGDVAVKGSFYAYTKYFRIAHPSRDDHELLHSSLEGPEIGVYYRGRGKLVGGTATIQLPSYFEALTRPEGRTVQLTPLGKEPYLLSAEEIVDGTLVVHGSVPAGEFCWQVIAIRADVAELQVEVKKDGA